MHKFKLQLLTTKYENLRMSKDVTIGQYCARVCDISNEAFSSWGRIPEQRLVRKVLRSLPKRFAYKVTTIVEAKNVKIVKLENPTNL